MADKKTYYFLSGVTMPNFIENPITYNADGTMVFPVESLRILDGYFNAEMFYRICMGTEKFADVNSQ